MTRPSWIDLDIWQALTLLAELPTTAETPGIASRDESIDQIILLCRMYTEDLT